jgi:DNA-directed RNA polymerase subunit RPC12/RpoP
MPQTPGRFRRVIEDFICFNCGAEVKGSGYTDHCPSCLWSLHVDNNPGDRASKCKGAMRPVGVVYDRTWYTIDYVCTKCGARKRFKASEADSRQALTSLINVAM